MDHKTTWDGRSRASEPPFGATVIVYRRSQGLEFLVLHRRHALSAPDQAWAWTPPSGARLPGEDVWACARRELQEETGLTLSIEATSFGTPEWSVYLAEAAPLASIALDAEHDRFEWVDSDEAVRRCAPSQVSEPLVRAAAHLVAAGAGN